MKTYSSFYSRLRRKLAGIEPLWLLLLAVTILFLGLMVASSRPPEQFTGDTVAQAGLTSTPQPAQTTVFSNTPIPAEFLANATQTNGIVLGAVILILIIVIGTLSVMLREDHRKR